MASNRSKTRTHDAVQAASTDTPTQALTALTRRAVRIQIAACSAAAKTFSRWVQAGDDLAQVVGDELLRRVDGQSDSAELVTRVTQATGSHLRELSALPRTATDHFDARLARGPSTTRRDRRQDQASCSARA